jgi:hypothetical protein
MDVTNLAAPYCAGPVSVDVYHMDPSPNGTVATPGAFTCTSNSAHGTSGLGVIVGGFFNYTCVNGSWVESQMTGPF